MTTERIDGVKPVKKKMADGSTKVFYYHRATNTRLPDDPTSPGFKLALERANREADDAKPPAEGEETLSMLIRQYQASENWRKLAQSTKDVEVYHIKAIEGVFGGMTLKDVQRKGTRGMFLEWRDDMAEDTPRSADAKLGRLATILKFAYDREKIDRHPLATFKRIYKADRSDKIWLPEHFTALNESKAKPAMKLAAFVALHTGQRRGDLIALQWPQYDGTGITLVQSKTKARVYVPCTRALKAVLDDLKTLAEGRPTPGAEPGIGHNAEPADISGLHILNSSRGSPWTSNAFRLAWVHAFDAAGIEDDLHFHDIRGTAVTMLAEAGCTVPEIATITGHTLASVTRILERYLSRTKALAESAIAKLELRMGGRENLEYW